MIKKAYINFSLNKHNNFLKESLDYNNIHLFKKNNKLVVVHGINILLTVLDKIYEKKRKLKISSLDVRFFKPLLLSKKKNFRLIIIYNKGIYEVYQKKERLLSVKINFEQKDIDYNYKKNSKTFTYKKINKLKIKNLYPNFFLGDKLSLIGDFMNLSRYLGTIYPGDNSLISNINFKIIEKSNKKIKLNFLNFDKRLNLSKIYIRVGNLNATITSFHAPKLPISYSLRDIKNNKKTKFLGISQNALVIGGSSGIGEIVSKIIFLNGGNVCMTYYKNNIKKKMNLNKYKNFSSIKFNINESKDYLKLKKFKKINSLYYFSSPNINNQLKERTNLNTFLDFYIRKLEKIIKFFHKYNKNFTLFYPSTIFIGQKSILVSLKDYTLAKQIAEKKIQKLCKEKKIKLCILRLPITDTKQNISYLPIFKKSRIDVAINILNEMDFRLNQQNK